MKKLLTFLTLLTLFFGVGWAEDQTITLTAATFGSPTSYQEKTATVSGYGFTVNQMMTSTNPKGAIQMNSSKGDGTLFNTTAIPGLKSIKVNVASGNKTYTVTTGTSQNPTTNSQTGTTGGTYNAQSGDTYFQLKVSGASYFSSIEITYDPDASSAETYDVTCNSATNGSISVGNTTSYAEGATVTVTATPENGYKLNTVTVTPTTSGVATPEVTISGNTATFQMPASDVEVNATFTEIVTTQYKLVENANDLDAGAEYILVGSTNSAPYSGILGSISSNIGTVETTGFNYDSSEKTITIEDGSNVTPLKLGGSKDAWTFHNGTGYLSYTGSSNTLSTANDASSKTAQWIIYDDVMPSSNILIANANSTSRYINYNSSTTPKRFACYTGSGLQSAVALFKKVETGDYTITVDDAIEHGTVTASRSSANENDQVVVNITPDAGYELASLTVDGTNVTSIVSDNSYSFNMPAHNVTITATFSKVNYTITKAPMTNGNVTVPATANYGDVVTITPEPATDYVVDKVYYNDGSDHEVAINNNAYTFTMPASNVTVWATFVEYYPTLRLAGRFNGRSASSWITDNSGPEFTYDTSTEKYTIDAFFTGATQDQGSDVDFFYLRSDDNDLKAAADGNCWVAAEGGTYTLGGSSNFRIYPGVYNITVNKARTSITFTKITPALTFSPNGGEVEAGQTVTVTSNLQSLVDAIKTTFDSGAQVGTVSAQVSTDQNTWSDNVTLNTIGTQTVYGRAFLGNIYATGNAAYNVVAANTSTQYQLIKSTDGLIAGKKYIIVSTGSYTTSGTTYNFTKAAGAPNAANNLILDADVTISDEIVDLDGISGVTEFTLGGSTGKWTFAFGDGTYLASSAAKSAKADVTATPASISFNGNEATINMGSVGFFQYNPNNGNGRFAAYTSTQRPVMLFKQVEGTVTQKSAAPVITPEAGNIGGYSQEVEITQANGGTIYYTTDGTTPTETSTQYDGKFWAEVSNLGDEVTITAVAKEEGKELSNPVSVTYKFVAPVAPVFTPAGGTYTTAQEVSISSTTEGADVYYTTTAGLSAAQIVAQGTKFTTAINVSEETTYYAVTVYHDAHANRDALSSVRQAQYKFSEVESVGLPYTRSFTDNSWGEFTREEGNSNITVWTLDGEYGAKGTSYVDGYNYAATSWLLSPYINLSNANEPVLTFDHQINKHFANPSTQATVWIKTYGGEWTQLTTKLPSSSSGISGWPKYNEEYDLSAYNGQIVQIGFKYSNPTEGDNAGTWEIQNFKLVDMNQPIIEVNNIAEFMDNEKVPADRKAKILNPVVVLYHYQQYRNDNEGDYVNDYIWVKDESGYAIIYGKYLDVNYTNGDIIPGGFTATKFYYNVGRFYQMYYPEGLQPATEKALADPEAVTLSILNSNKENYNGHYVTIPKMRIKFSSGELVPYEYNFTTEESYGGQRNFEIGDATLSISSNNKSIIGYNNFDNPWLETLGYPEYENTTSDYGDYNITGIFERYNGVWEFMPIIITPWEENKVTLHDLCQDGVVNEEYTISNPLQVVYVDTDRHSVWVKDDNGQSIWSTSPAATDKNFAIDYADNTRDNQAYYDQSNWCQLVFDGEIPSSLSRNPIIKGGMIKGTFTNKLNPTLSNVVLGDEPIMQESSSYATNYYVARNFAANSDGYFFMNPKPQEYADIVWAIYDETNNAMIMTSNPKQNPNGFVGSFKVDMSMNIKPNLELVDGTQTGKGYEHFKAIVRLASTSNAPMLKDRMPANTEYVVFPLDINENVPTGITDVNGKAVKSVKYVNVAGVMSDVPFEGVNIVVTEYTDGSRSTSKMIKR